MKRCKDKKSLKINLLGKRVFMCCVAGFSTQIIHSALMVIFQLIFYAVFFG